MFDDDVDVQIGHTRGKNIKFEWILSVKGITIRSEKGKIYAYSTLELVAVLMWLYSKFGQSPFPLANNPELLGQYTEQDGLGVALYTVKPQPVFVQAASYLGLVLEQLDIFEHVKGSPIQWKIKHEPEGFSKVIAKLTAY